MGRTRILAFAAGMTLAAGTAWAQNTGGGATGSWGSDGNGTSALEEVCGHLMTLWDWAQPITYLMALISLALIAIKAFGGKLEMSRFIWCGVVLFLFSSTPLVLAFMTSGSVSEVECSL